MCQIEKQRVSRCFLLHGFVFFELFRMMLVEANQDLDELNEGAEEKAAHCDTEDDIFDIEGVDKETASPEHDDQVLPSFLFNEHGVREENAAKAGDDKHQRF